MSNLKTRTWRKKRKLKRRLQDTSDHEWIGFDQSQWETITSNFVLSCLLQYCGAESLHSPPLPFHSPSLIPGGSSSCLLRNTLFSSGVTHTHSWKLPSETRLSSTRHRKAKLEQLEVKCPSANEEEQALHLHIPHQDSSSRASELNQHHCGPTSNLSGRK